MPVDTLTSPQAAVAELAAQLSPVAAESVPLAEAAGRVLAAPVAADRDSPAADVSAMDGYAVRIADLGGHDLPVVGEVLIGHRPPVLPPRAAVRIFTGGCVPEGAEAVIAREQVEERPDAIGRLRAPPPRGANIRRQGENLRAGQIALAQGRILTPAAIGAVASHSHRQVSVHRRASVAVLVTGNELRPAGEPITPYQIRDSNGPALVAMLAVPWLRVGGHVRVGDDPAALRDAMASALDACDAILLTGGVSVGDHDYTRQAVEQVGGRVVFHKLPLRPGRPVLGAVGPRGQLIMGLPGNPVSGLVTARVLAAPGLRRLAGLGTSEPQMAVEVQAAAGTLEELWWFRPVEMLDAASTDGRPQSRVLPTRGSGDLISAGRAQGFVEVPPGKATGGWHRFYPWTL